MGVAETFWSKEAGNRRALRCDMGPLLEDEDLVGLDGPGGELVHAGAGRLVDQVFLGESAGVEAGAAAGEVAAVAVDGLEHLVEGVVAVGCLLSRRWRR